MRRATGSNARMGALIMMLLMLAGATGAVAQQCPVAVWVDEFDGTTLDLSKWSYQLGDGCDIGLCGWGNNEEQYYKQENVTVSNGSLKITAKKERVRSKKYTSGRLRTLGKGDFFFGRMEARIKLTQGQGIWPAFWMMPTDEVFGGWPASGEIDIMENVGHETKTVHGTIHYGSSPQNHQLSGASFKRNAGQPIFADGFHEFAIEKEAGEIRWFVDDVLFFTRTANDVAPANWPFDERFHFILNVAVGGNWPGSPDNTTVFPQTLEVDYVRVYDSPFPHLTGDRVVAHQAQDVAYAVGNAPSGSTFTWSVPSGATIVSGQGTSSIRVDWGSTGGDVSVEVASGCGTEQLAVNVEVEPPYAYDFSFENFDEPGAATLNLTTGTLNEVSNPDPSGVNTSALVGAYTRNAAEQYDLLFYAAPTLGDASDYVTKQKKFYVDVYTAAPPGTAVLLQLEDNATATSTNYPAGRHSRYQAFTSVQNAWERLTFDLLDQPDPGTPGSAVDDLVLFFAPNTFTGDLYYFDNLDSYQVDTGGGTTPDAPSGLAATAVSSSGIDLSWADNSTDEDGFRVERSTDGANFSEVAQVGANTTAYSDAGLAASTTYYYRVRAFNVAGSSAYSNTASATTSGGGTPTTMQVTSVTTGTQSAGKGNKYGTATVTILDDQGGPVQGATVTGTFSGSYNEAASGTTGADGTVTLVTQATQKGGVIVNFCVDDVTHASLSYDPASNSQTCSTDPAGKRLEGILPAAYALHQNYPNPFNPETRFSFALPEGSLVRVSIFDVLGREVRRLVDGYRPAGLHAVLFDAADLPSGLYFYTLQAGAHHETRRMTLLR